jgi:hypothetical protein
MVAFAFTDIAGGWMVVNHLPPTGAQGVKNDWKKLEEGIPVKGAELLTPQISEKSPIASK